MTWQLRIPYRDRSEPIAAVGDLARNLTGEDRAVARQLALDAAMNGMRTVGDLLDGMERASATERRQMLDRARERVGLPDTKTAEARERFEAINQSLPPIDTARDPSGRIPATCSAWLPQLRGGLDDRRGRAAARDQVLVPGPRGPRGAGRRRALRRAVSLPAERGDRARRDRRGRARAPGARGRASPRPAIPAPGRAAGRGRESAPT